MTARRLCTLGLLAMFLLMPGLSVFTQGRDGMVPNLTEQIAFTMSVDPDDGKLHIIATGIPSVQGIITIAMLPQGGSQVALITVPVTFDSLGSFAWATHLNNFATWPAFDCVAVLSSNGADGSSLTSAPWGLRMRRYSYETIAGLPLPSGGSLSLPLPGTTAPQFPVTWLAQAGPNLAGTGTECLFFVTAVPGIEGVLPVN